jgi:hypothetical protein
VKILYGIVSIVPRGRFVVANELALEVDRFADRQLGLLESGREDLLR